MDLTVGNFGHCGRFWLHSHGPRTAVVDRLRQ